MHYHLVKAKCVPTAHGVTGVKVNSFFRLKWAGDGAIFQTSKDIVLSTAFQIGSPETILPFTPSGLDGIFFAAMTRQTQCETLT
jgi:hypothetical protein